MEYLRWLMRSGVTNEIGPDAIALLTVVVTHEDTLRYNRPPTFWNNQLAAMCGIGSENALIRARTRAIEAGLLCYLKGNKRQPGTYFVCGLTSEKEVYLDAYPEVKENNPRINHGLTSEKEVNPLPSIPITYTEAPIKKESELVSPFLADEEFSQLLDAFCYSSRKNHHWVMADTTVQAWLYRLQDLGLTDAKEALRFSTFAGSKTPIVNGDHKKSRDPKDIYGSDPGERPRRKQMVIIGEDYP